MSRSLVPSVVLLVGVLVAVPSAPPACGCAIVPPRDGHTDVSSETALIVYDSTGKTEHFIRTASFNSTSADFGFLVPTPSKPELAESSPDVFRELTDITKPRSVTKWRMKEPNFGCALMPEARVDFTSVGSAINPGGVSVVEQKRVGAYDAAVLQAEEPKALREWLTTNGYEARPQLDEWFKAYTANKWFLTAFKIAADGASSVGERKTVNNTAVRISFQTDVPVYPYREPEDARTGEVRPRLLRLFVLTDSRVSGTVGRVDLAKEFGGKTVWSNTVGAGLLKVAGRRGELVEQLGTRDWHLTEFEDRSSPRPGTDELYLTSAADQSAVERPPNVVYEYYDPWPWVTLGVAAFGVSFVAILIGRAVRKKGPGGQPG
jgi:hypothetical protein